MNQSKWRIYVIPASATRNFYAPKGAFVVRQPGCDTPPGTVCAPRHCRCCVCYRFDVAVNWVSNQIQRERIRQLADEVKWRSNQ